MIRNQALGNLFGQPLVAFCSGLLVILTASIALAEDPEVEEGWKGDISLSVTAQSGSVDTFAGAVGANAERNWTNDTVGIRFTGVYGTTRDRAGQNTKQRTIQNSQGLFGDWKHVIHERFFWDSGTELSRDSTQNRDVRFRAFTGPGYRAWQGEDPDVSHFDLSAALGYRYEFYDRNRDVSPALMRRSNTFNLADLIAGFEYRNNLFDGRIEWLHTGSVAMPVNNVDAYIITTEAIAGVPLSEAWSLRLGVYYEYVNDVPNDVNPSTLRATLGLGYKF